MAAVNLKALSPKNISIFLNSFDTVLTDCDGVIWMHMTSFPKASNVLNTFRELGKKVYYVTNNSTKTRDEFVQKCRTLSFKAEKEDVVCTANLVATYLKDIGFSKKVYVIGPKAVGKELDNVGIAHCGIGPDPINPKVHYSSFKKDPDVGAVIVGFDEHFSYPKMVKAATYLNDASIPFIGTNTDERFPANTGIVVPGTGSFVRCIESCTNRKAKIIGKPESYLADFLVKHHNVNTKRTLMIGDRCNTDILLGKRCGFQTLLVLTGVTTLAEVEVWKESKHQEERDLVPDYYINALGDLLPYLKKLCTDQE